MCIQRRNDDFRSRVDQTVMEAGVDELEQQWIGATSALPLEGHLLHVSKPQVSIMRPQSDETQRSPSLCATSLCRLIFSTPAPRDVLR